MAKIFNYQGLLEYSKFSGERVAIFDIDGTISDSSHRVHLVRDKPKDYHKFHMECVNDAPILPVIQFLEDTAEHSHIFFVTGRNEFYRNLTIDWLKKYVDIAPTQYTLMMRHDKDHRKDYDYKKDILNEILRAGYLPRFAVEDRKQVKKMYVSEGIFVFDVNQFDEDY